MKKIFLIFVTIFMFFVSNGYVDASIFSDSSVKIPYCPGNECSLKGGIEEVKNSGIDGVVTEGKASEYIQLVIVYVLGFLQLLAIVIIIYAGFNMLTAAGDEDKAKKSKTMIIYAIIGLAIIFLAGPITTFVLDIFTQASN